MPLAGEMVESRPPLTGFPKPVRSAKLPPVRGDTTVCAPLPTNQERNRLKIRSPFLNRLGATAFAAMIWLVFRLVKLDFREETPGTNPYKRGRTDRFLYCVWHDSMIIPAFSGKHHATAALTSRHLDGTFVAQILQCIGITPIRGSTNRMGPGAMKGLLRACEDKDIVITPDGPRGPHRKMSKGIVYIASRTGRAVVPTAYSCARYWTIKGSWTDLVVPKPFTRVYLLAAEPITVPPELGEEGLRAYVDQIQTAMDRLNGEAERRVQDRGG
jgi:hypothetical protein